MGELLLSNEMWNFIRTRDWPLRAKWQVIPGDQQIDFVVYRENINSLTGDEKMQFATVLNTVLTSIQKTGIPIYTDVRPGYGP